MMRTAQTTVVILAIFWQSVVSLTSFGQVRFTEGIANAMAHAMSLDHHHHQDLSLHIDHTADESHHHAHDGSQPSGLVPHTDHQQTKAVLGVPTAHGAKEVLRIYLEGPLRPPKPLPSQA